MIERWTWAHTVLLIAACIAISYILYKLTGMFVFLLLFIPPLIMIKRGRK